MHTLLCYGQVEGDASKCLHHHVIGKLDDCFNVDFVIV